ncbi:MAG: FecCD family ABC transporter permease [Dermatophilaceae bacterium]
MTTVHLRPPSAAHPRVGAGRTTGRRRSLLVGCGLGVAVATLFVVSLAVGDFPIPVGDVLAALAGSATSDAGFIVLELRLPRALTGLAVGLAFGLSGAVLQALARNPLASPDIIGITAGASTAAVLVITSGSVIGVGVLSSVGVPASALAGGLLTAAVVHRLARRGGSVPPYRLVLVGIGVGAMLTSATSYLLTRADITDAARATVWLTGSLNGRTWADAWPAVAAVLVLLPVILALARPLRALQLGEQAAAGLGVPVERTRRLLVLVSVAAASVATAAAGPVAFVAFVAAPVARRLIGTPLTLLPAALVGAVVVLASDLLARLLFAPTELPVGVVTGVVGAPYLLWLLARAQRTGATD